ncbi:type I restriction endonuclease subunit R [bacterium]|nr:type I restriction endonuclease subunit R [bacterium]
MTSFISENFTEESLLSLLEAIGFEKAHGPDLSPEGTEPERDSFSTVTLFQRLSLALERINPSMPPEAIEDAARKVVRTETPSLIENNRRFHRMLTHGVPVEYHEDGRIKHDQVWLVDTKNVGNNDWLAVNQFTVVEGDHNRRPDIVLFLNGLPVAVIELKNPADEDATIKKAFHQLQTYKSQIPSLFTFNELLVITDGFEAKAGTLTADWERFMPWRTVDGVDIAPVNAPQMDVLIEGIFSKERFLDYLLNFIVFEDDGQKVVKKAAAYHQFWAVKKALAATLRACGADPEADVSSGGIVGVSEDFIDYVSEDSAQYGDRRVGVVWHTQGSGKSLSMVFYSGKVIQHPAMQNPTLVVITDKNDLDDQLFGTFSNCHDLLRQRPVQAESRKDLRDKLKVAAGGVIFTTIQKFLPEAKGDTYPELSDRQNIVVIADEAHRSQYGFIEGFARHMRDALPKASFIGFTGTPIESGDKNTPAVFGDYLDIYDIQRAVEDGATVRIYYEGRLAKIELAEAEKPKIDPEFEELTEGEDEPVKHKLKSKWARLEAMVGAPKRVELVANDLVQHFEQRLEAIEGKAMIVCMSRRICVALYNAIVKLRPAWHAKEDEKGAIKVVMTGSASDPLEWQEHARNKPRREALAKRFKDPADGLKLVIVRDMWLTGFDAPCMHTMYVDKPMRGHGLMQAIARVNRVFKDKPGGLIVDYLGLADQLKKALMDYTQSGGKGSTTIDQEEAVAIMKEKYEIVCGILHGFDFRSVVDGPQADRMKGVLECVNIILTPKSDTESPDERKSRFLQAVTELSKAFALAVPHEEAIGIRDDVGFFQTVKAGIAKLAPRGPGKSPEDLDTAVRQIVSRAVSSDEVVDIFAQAGLKKPDISILSEEFLEEVKHLKQKNLAVEMLRKLMNDEIKTRSRSNLVQARSFSEMLEQAIRKYQNRSIEAAQVIQELIELAKQMNEAYRRGEELGLTEDEVAFYDALEVNDSAVQILGDDCLKTIAHELVQAIRKNVSIDWSARESARARMRLLVKKILKKYGYPPDKQEKATQTVLEQAELLCGNVA